MHQMVVVEHIVTRFIYRFEGEPRSQNVVYSLISIADDVSRPSIYTAGIQMPWILRSFSATSVCRGFTAVFISINSKPLHMHRNAKRILLIGTLDYVELLCFSGVCT